MRIAVVCGGWHFPLMTYRALAAQADNDVDLFCIGHRSPDHPNVRAEILPFKNVVTMGYNPTRDQLISLDMELYYTVDGGEEIHRSTRRQART